MIRLERRYRRLLRVLPAWYRADREQEMVEVFLAERVGRDHYLNDAPEEGSDGDTGDLDAEYGWPGWGEAVSVLGLAVRTRFGGVDAPAPARVVGDATRLVAVLGVLTLATLAVLPALSGLAWWVWGPPLRQQWWNIAVFGLHLMWVPAYAALAYRRYRMAWVFAGAALIPSVVGLGQSILQGPAESTLSALGAALPQWVTVLCLVLGFRRDAPPLPVGWSRRAIPAAALAGIALTSVTTVLASTEHVGLLPEVLAVFLGAFVVLARRRRLHRTWASATLVLALVLAVTSGTNLLSHGNLLGSLLNVGCTLAAIALSASARQATKPSENPSVIPSAPTKSH